MEITEVRIFLKTGQDKKLKAYATVTFDNCFVVRDIKVIEGTKGPFIAMPSRRMKEPCPKCGHRNLARSKYCNQCAAALPVVELPIAVDDKTRQLEHKDIAHPITADCREYLQKKILAAYDEHKLKGPETSSYSNMGGRPEETDGGIAG